jgi:hypothetical protein
MARRKSADTVALPPERHERAELLRPLVGQLVTLVWAIGSQQQKHVIKGRLKAVTPRHAELADTYPLTHGGKFLVSLRFLVRFESEEWGSVEAAPLPQTKKEGV